MPLILKPCLYLVVLEEDKGVQCIPLYSIIPILVPNILKLHAAFFLFRSNCTHNTHNHYLNMMFYFHEAACPFFFSFFCFRDIRIKRNKRRHLRCFSLHHMSAKIETEVLMCITEMSLIVQ